MDREKTTEIATSSQATAAIAFWIMIFNRALKEGLFGTMTFIVLLFPWLTLQWIRIRIQPESHQEETNPFIYTMQ